MEDSFKKLLIFILTNCNLNAQWFDGHLNIDEEHQETIYESESFKLIYCKYYDYYEINGLNEEQYKIVELIVNYGKH